MDQLNNQSDKEIKQALDSTIFDKATIIKTIALILMVIFIILMYKLLFFIRSEGYKCSQNPFQYGSANLKKQNPNINLQCQCIFKDDPSKVNPQIFNTLYFNEKGGYFKAPFGSIYDRSNYSDINYSDWEFKG